MYIYIYIYIFFRLALADTVIDCFHEWATTIGELKIFSFKYIYHSEYIYSEYIYLQLEISKYFHMYIYVIQI